MSFFFLLLYLICTFLRPQDWMVGFYGMPLIFILSILTLVCLIFERSKGETPGLINVPQNRLIVGLFLAVIMSHVTHTYFEGMTLAIQSFYVNVVLFFIILNTLNTPRKFKIAVWFIAALILLLAFQGIFQASHGFGWAGQEITQDLSQMRNAATGEVIEHASFRINWVGIFNDPNDLALVFVIAVGIILAFIFSKTKLLVKLIGIPVLGTLLYGIYLTNSRGGMLALAATVLFYFTKRTRKFILGGVIGLVLVGAIFAFGPSRMALLSGQEDSAYTRMDLWYEGLQMFKRNPLFGVGYNMFQEELPQTAHNSFVLAAAELGFVGLFFFVGLIYASFKELSLIQKSDTALKSYALGIQSALVGFSAAAFFLSRSYIILPYMFFALAGALFFLARQKNKKIAFNFAMKDIRNTAVLSLGVLALVFITTKIGL